MSIFDWLKGEKSLNTLAKPKSNIFKSNSDAAAKRASDAFRRDRDRAAANQREFADIQRRSHNLTQQAINQSAALIKKGRGY